MTTQSTEERNATTPGNASQTDGPEQSFMAVSRERKSKSLWTGGIISGAVRDSFLKLNPRTLMKNPVMFVVEIGSVITSYDLIRDRLLHLAGFGFELRIP